MKIFVRSIILIALLSTSACSTMKNAKMPSITQTKWILETLYGDKINYGADQAAAFMEFKEDKVNGYGGCNKFFGGYTLEGTSLDFGMLGSTKMACPTSDLEGKFMKALDETQSFAVEDGQLALKSGGATVATFKPE